MSLRARLLLLIAIILCTYGLTAFLVVQNQRELLISQIDRRLASLPPPVPPDQVGSGTGAPAAPGSIAGSYSDVYIAWILDDGTVEPQVIGSLLSEQPDVTAGLAAGQSSFAFRTIESASGNQRFRAFVQPSLGAQGAVVTAFPLREADAAIGRLTRTLLLAGVVIASVLAALFLWIQRLGIAPIGRLVRTAEAVTSGNRTQRAVDTDPRTETGKLGIAFNVMLDEIDLNEARLRQFIADASHELRTPLTSMRGYLELYRQGAFRDPAQMDDVVRRMSSETERMTDLVKDLLSLASLDEGRPLRYDMVDLGRLMRDAAQDALAVQPARQIDVDTPPEGPWICGDSALLVQLIGTLVTNALVHTPVDASISLEASAIQGDARLEISDTGPGMDSDAAEHAFDRFWRGEASRQRRATGGSGLGLAIAKSIVDAHGGTIELETSPGEGASFTVYLPSGTVHCEPEAVPSSAGDGLATPIDREAP